MTPIALRITYSDFCQVFAIKAVRRSSFLNEMPMKFRVEIRVFDSSAFGVLGGLRIYSKGELRQISSVAMRQSTTRICIFQNLPLQFNHIGRQVSWLSSDYGRLI